MTTIRRTSLALAALLTACGSSSGETPPAPTTTAPPAIPEPAPAQALGGLAALPAATFDHDEAMLGRRLFFDPRLSGDGTVACATCHQLDHGGAEARATSLGIRQQVGPINAPSVLNSSLNFVQFWDGRAPDLETQCAGPVTNPLEMGATWDQALAAIRGDATYVAAFADVYSPAEGVDPISQENVTGAISEYERMLVTPGRFDRFVGGDATAMTDDERRGYALFTSVGCTTCHTGAGVGGTMYQRLGVVNDYFAECGRPLTDADNGRFNVTHDEADRHRFKVPSLRNVALTAPYFHDGSRADLADAVRTMGHYQLGRELSDEQVRLIVAFLGALTGEVPSEARLPTDTATPEAPPTPVSTPTGPPTTEAPADPATVPPGGPRS
jgi:cytochrome c peroxidase